jgi:hypothetical protein
MIVPLRKIWLDWHEIHDEPSFEQFSREILHDDRFEELYCVAQDTAVEEFDCFTGPRIKLRTREITSEHILNLVRQHNEKIARKFSMTIDKPARIHPAER